MAVTWNPLSLPARFQFGQANAPVCHGVPGATCCGDTSNQMLVEFYTGTLRTLNDLRALGGGIAPCLGETMTAASMSLRKAGVPNDIVYGASFDAAVRYAKVGRYPTVAVNYGKFPYPFRTDASFTGSHQMLYLGPFGEPGEEESDLWRDPDHNSASRAERPAATISTRAQSEAGYKGVLRLWPAGAKTVLIVPQKAQRDLHPKEHLLVRSVRVKAKRALRVYAGPYATGDVLAVVPAGDVVQGTGLELGGQLIALRNPAGGITSSTKWWRVKAGPKNLGYVSAHSFLSGVVK